MPPSSDSDSTTSERGAPGRRSSRSQRKYKATFGLKRNVNRRRQYRGNDPFNYEEKYAEDPTYEELGPNARVWRAYLDESTIFDADMVNESTDSVDVLLVFAGLFSAVVSAFVVQTSEYLQVDFTEVSASLLYEVALLQRAFIDGKSTSDHIPASPNPATLTPQVSSLTIWVNALWYASLVTSLSTALVAVLVKQWLHQYMNLPSGTARHRSHVRQFRYAGFRAWKVGLIIGLLPVLMHLSLALFLIGLVIFLCRMASPIAWTVGAVLTIVYTAYVVSLVLPMIYTKCPYRTPLSNIVFTGYCYGVRTWRNAVSCVYGTRASPLQRRVSSDLHMSTFLKDAEAKVVDAVSSDLSIDALRWLYSMSSNPTVHSIIVESVGALPLSSRSNPKVQEFFGANSDIYTTYLQLLKTSLHITPVGRRPNVGLEKKAARLLRYGLHVDLPQMRIRVRVEKEDPIEFAVAAFSSQCGPWRGSADMSWILPFLTGVFHMPTPPAFPLSVWFRLVQNATRDGSFLSDRTFSVPFGSSILTSLSQAMRPSTPLDEDAPVTFADAIELHPDFRSQLTDTLLPHFQQCNNIFYNPLVHPNLRMALAIVDYATLCVAPQWRLNAHHSDWTMVQRGGEEWVDDTDDQEAAYALITYGLVYILLFLRFNDVSDREVSVVLAFIARFNFRSQLFHEPDARVSGNRSVVIQIYHRVVRHAFRAVEIPPATFTALWFPLSFMLKFMFDDKQIVSRETPQWKTDFNDLYPVLVVGLENAVGPVYEAFVQNNCFEHIAVEPWHEMWAEIVIAYISGLVRARDFGTVPGMASSDLVQYARYIYQPDNLVLACVLVALLPRSSTTSKACHPIRSLRSLNAGHPAWEICRQRLRLFPVITREMMEDSEDASAEDANPVVLVDRDDPLYKNYTVINEILDEPLDSFKAEGEVSTVLSDFGGIAQEAEQMQRASMPQRIFRMISGRRKADVQCNV